MGKRTSQVVGKSIIPVEVNNYETQINDLEKDIEDLEDKKEKLKQAYTVKENELLNAEENFRKQIETAEMIRCLKKNNLVENVANALEGRALSWESKRIIDLYKKILDILDEEISDVDKEIKNNKDKIDKLRVRN